MAEPFVFHFKPAPGGRPQLLYIADVRAECGLCKDPQIQRFYHGIDFHQLTLARMRHAAETAREKTSYVCENCGEEVHGAHAKDTVTTFGFADDAGLIRFFCPEGGPTRTQLVPNRRLDPQELPGWAPDPQMGQVFETIDAWDVEDGLQRAINPKRAWIQLLEDFIETGEESWTCAGRGVTYFVAETDERLEELVDDALYDDERLFRDPDFQDTILIRLDDAVPDELGTHDDPEAIFGRWQKWLPPAIRHAIEAERFCTAALVSPHVVRLVLERTFELGRLTWEVDDAGDDVWFRNLTTPGEITYGRDLSIEAILRRATYTGITPGDAARLTAEEVVGVLLRVWTYEDVK